MINWQTDDGVNLPMINDHVRNQFYENIILDNVKDKTVLDVGFGTGLLSILALKHGAKKIIAYEANEGRFHLGQEMIETCELQNKIELRHSCYDWTMQAGIACDVVVSETISSDIWSEGMWNSLPRNTGPLFLPGEYFCEIYTKPIPKSFAQSMSIKKSDPTFFNPGVDIDQNFVQFINKKISDWNGHKIATPQGREIKNGINADLANNIDSVWGWHPWLKIVLQDEAHTQYIVDANKMTLNGQAIDYETSTIISDIHLDPDCYTLVVPRMGIKYLNHKMYLDTACWGTTRDAIVCIDLPAIKMNHCIRTGNIKYDIAL